MKGYAIIDNHQGHILRERIISRIKERCPDCGSDNVFSCRKGKKGVCRTCWHKGDWETFETPEYSI